MNGRSLARALLCMPSLRAAAVSGVLVLSALLSGAVPGTPARRALDPTNSQAFPDSAPTQPGPVVVGPAGRVAVGDTLIYTIRWGPGARATSYLYTLSAQATNGAWSMVADSNGSGKWVVALPALPYTCPANCVTWTWLKMWLSAVPWDSATFTFTVASQNAVGVSAPISATWRVLRKPGVPGLIVVDSSLVVVGVLLQPPTLTVAVGGTAPICAFAQFHDGAVATQTGASCTRQLLWKFPNAAQQAHTDSMCFRWASSDPTKATVAAAAC